MNKYSFNWQRFLILFGITFGFGILAMMSTDEGLGYYLKSLGLYDLVICIIALAVIVFCSFEK